MLIYVRNIRPIKRLYQSIKKQTIASLTCSFAPHFFLSSLRHSMWEGKGVIVSSVCSDFLFTLFCMRWKSVRILDRARDHISQFGFFWPPEGTRGPKGFQIISNVREDINSRYKVFSWKVNSFWNKRMGVSCQQRSISLGSSWI